MLNSTIMLLGESVMLKSIGNYEDRCKNEISMSLEGEDLILKNHSLGYIFSGIYLGNGHFLSGEEISVENAKLYLDSYKEHISLEQSCGYSMFITYGNWCGVAFYKNPEEVLSSKPCTHGVGYVGFSIDGSLCYGTQKMIEILESGRGAFVYVVRGLSKGPKIPKIQRDFNLSIQDLEKI